MLTGNKNSEELFFFSISYNHVFKHATWSGSLSWVTVGARNVLRRERECVQGWSDSSGVQRTTRECKMIRPGKRTGPRRGGNAEPGGVVTVLFGKQVPFLQRLYSCLPLWIAFLLPLVCKWRENTTSCVLSKKKRRKKNWKETSDSDLWHSFLANRGKNQDE